MANQLPVVNSVSERTLINPGTGHATSLRGCLTLLLLATFVGCATERPFVWVRDLRPEAAGDAGSLIQPRDSIGVVVANQTALSGEFVVHDDGTYMQPMLGNVMVAGHSPAEVAADLQVRLKDMVVSPHVTVSIAKVASIRVSVVGEVKTPGSYELTRDRSVAGALAAAGWLTDFAASDRIFVLRRGEKAQERIRFTLREVTSPDASSAWFRLRDGDVVVVE
jgi:polysaccharide export outer membrane protein